MILAAQLWAGYLAAHPMWIVALFAIAVGAAWFLLAAAADMGEKPGPRAVSLTSPPAAFTSPQRPAGAVPGPASPSLAPEEDAGSPAAVLGPGPGTRNGPPWEPIVHEPLAAPTSDAWSKQPALPGGDR